MENERTLNAGKVNEYSPKLKGLYSKLDDTTWNPKQIISCFKLVDPNGGLDPSVS